MQVDRFDSRGWLVRWPIGSGYEAYPVPGEQPVRIMVFPHGVSVLHPRLSQALEIARRLRERMIQ